MTADLHAALAAAVHHARRIPGGEVTSVYPALAAVPRDLLGAAVRLGTGRVVGVGDTDARFVLMSVAKPFVLALAVDALGADAVLARTGMRATEFGFNDPEAIRASPDGRTNPMVNPGAITVASLMTQEGIREGLSAFAGRRLDAPAPMVEAIHASNARNRELAGLLDERGLLGRPLEEALHLYTYQSCVNVTVADLAHMGAVVANGGVDPVSGARTVSRDAADTALEAMALAGLYEASHTWMAAVGVPAKSGIAGGLVMIAPGHGALATYSPPLDAAGNPLRGQAIASAMAPVLTSAGR